ncbi:MAG: 8-oxo-dGTP diphosphatase [Defluviitaleaceae bacterium]|nr:8-oxo-dGTP diphosphatase [Defluviitaleaceae bacterium]
MKLGTLCYIEKDDQYLMLHRTKKENDIHKNLWVGLGGKFEPGESPEECAIREVYEESGLTIKNPKLRGILTFPGFGDEDWYVFLFLITEFTGDIKPCDEGELRWIDKDKIKDLPMHKGDYYFVKWMEEHDGIFSAKYIYDGEILKDYQITVYN